MDELALLAERADDPVWQEARKRYGKLAPLLRLVDRANGTDEIIALPAMKDYAELRLNGCVVIRPDHFAYQNKTTRPSAPHRERQRHN
jgi:hypothetical protein